MSFEVILSVPFLRLDAATAVCLKGYAPGMLEYTREAVTPVLTVYYLRNFQLGDLGKVSLREVDDGLTSVEVSDPAGATWEEARACFQRMGKAWPGRTLTDLERNLPKDERRAIRLDISRAEWQACREVDQKRRTLQAAVLRAYNDRLVHDSVNLEHQAPEPTKKRATRRIPDSECVKLYLEQHVKVRILAKRYGVTDSAIYQRLRANGIERGRKVKR